MNGCQQASSKRIACRSWMMSGPLASLWLSPSEAPRLQRWCPSRQRKRTFFGFMAGEFKIVGDIESL